MFFVPPIVVDDVTLVSTSVPEAAPAAYAGGSTYALGDRVSVATGTARDVYQSLQNANIGHTPASSPTWWMFVARTYVTYAGGSTYALDDIVIDPVAHITYLSLQNGNIGHSLTEAGSTWWQAIAPTNARAMFDGRMSTATIASGEIRWTVNVAGRVDWLELLDIQGTAVNVTAMVGATEVFNQDFDLADYTGIVDYWSYCFAVRRFKRDQSVILPPYSGMTITTTLTGGSTVKVSTCIIGQSIALGDTEYGMRLGINDFSKKAQDPDFGEDDLVVRDYARRGNFTIEISGSSPEEHQSKVDATIQTLADYRATKVLWVGSPRYGSSKIYGWWESFDVEVQFAKRSINTLSARGIT